MAGSDVQYTSCVNGVKHVTARLCSFNGERHVGCFVERRKNGVIKRLLISLQSRMDTHKPKKKNTDHVLASDRPSCSPGEQLKCKQMRRSNKQIHCDRLVQSLSVWRLASSSSDVKSQKNRSTAGLTQLDPHQSVSQCFLFSYYIMPCVRLLVSYSVLQTVMFWCHISFQSR